MAGSNNALDKLENGLGEMAMLQVHEAARDIAQRIHEIISKGRTTLSLTPKESGFYVSLGYRYYEQMQQIGLAKPKSGFYGRLTKKAIDLDKSLVEQGYFSGH